MVTYDPKVIYSFAARLYRIAAWMIWSATLVGILTGGVGGWILGIMLSRSAIIGALLVALICGLIGYALGSHRALRLKLEAQTALCQVKIEEHARKQRMLAEGQRRSQSAPADVPATPAEPVMHGHPKERPDRSAETSQV